MTAPAWSLDWFGSGIARKATVAWRGVEAQHVLSTTRLVDDLDEQHALELMLETSKPPAPVMKGHKNFLIYTPFRYRPRHPSRFRRAGTRGHWYGAQELYAACAEVAYWRHRFIVDSDALTHEDVLTAHTFFQGAVDGLAIDLTVSPWAAAREAWTRDQDYTHTHAVAEAAADHKVQWICYESVRAPGYRCAAALDVEAVDLVANGTTQQTWQCKANRSSVMMLHDQDRHSWAF